jgi:hypothetical protein
MGRRVHKGHRCEARARATIRGTPDQSSSHVVTTELQFGEVPSACCGYQMSICFPYGTT